MRSITVLMWWNFSPGAVSGSPIPRKWPRARRGGNDEARAVLWARFRFLPTGEVFYVLNTHFHHVDPFETIRTQSAELIRKRLNDLTEGRPAILLGDFQRDARHAGAQAVHRRGERAVRRCMASGAGPHGTRRYLPRLHGQFGSESH